MHRAPGHAIFQKRRQSQYVCHEQKPDGFYQLDRLEANQLFSSHQTLFCSANNIHSSQTCISSVCSNVQYIIGCRRSDGEVFILGVTTTAIEIPQVDPQFITPCGRQLMNKVESSKSNSRNVFMITVSNFKLQGNVTLRLQFFLICRYIWNTKFNNQFCVYMKQIVITDPFPSRIRHLYLRSLAMILVKNLTARVYVQVSTKQHDRKLVESNNYSYYCRWFKTLDIVQSESSMGWGGVV